VALLDQPLDLTRLLLAEGVGGLRLRVRLDRLAREEAFTTATSSSFSTENPPYFAHRTVPSTSISTPLGTALKPNRALDTPASSTTTGNVTPARSTHGRARSAPLCSSAMPTIRLSLASCWDVKCCLPGSCSRHPHQEPQKKSNSRLPQKSARLMSSPSSEGSVRSGVGFPAVSVVAMSSSCR
jgi:hypothetical protein